MQTTGEVFDPGDDEGAPNDSNGAPECAPQYENAITHAAILELAHRALSALKAGNLAATEALILQLVERLANPEE